MKVYCIICTDVLSSDFAAAPCGHTFHFACLSQWIEHQQSCPQCREKCLPKNVIRLYFESIETPNCNIDDASDPEELRENLVLQMQLVKDKEKALTETQESLRIVRGELEAWQSQHEGLYHKLCHEQAANSTLKKQLSVLQFECCEAKKLKDEVSSLKERLDIVAGLEKILHDGKEEAEKLLSTYKCPKQLASFTVALKRDYESLKIRKGLLQKEKEKLQQCLNQLQKQVQSKDMEIGSYSQNLKAIQSDLHSVENERENLQKKVEFLETALETPTSRRTLKRILESPLPQTTKRHNIGPLCNGSMSSASKNKEELRNSNDDDAKPTESNEDESNALLPVNLVLKQSSSQNFASGYNGFGGQTSFSKPKSKVASKGLRFAPRSTTSGKLKVSSELPSLTQKGSSVLF